MRRRYGRSSSTAAYRGWEKRRERDEAVTVNLAPEEAALWRRIGASFKGPPEARLEAFQQYMHEHPDEVYEALQDDADARLEAMLAARDAEPWAHARRRAA